MLKTRIIPTLLKKKLGLVKGKNFKNLRRVTDVMPLIKIYNKRDVDEIVFLDIETTLNKKIINFDFIKNIAKELNIPFAYGGGIKSLVDAQDVLLSGADKIILNSSIYDDPNLITKISEFTGAQSIVISIDVKKINSEHYCFSHCGTKDKKINILDFFDKMPEQKFGEVIICSIDKEGTMEGYDLELIKKLSDKIKVPIIASGGAGSYEDMFDAINAGASAIAAGSIFHFTELTPSGAKKFLHNKGVNVRDGFKYQY